MPAERKHRISPVLLERARSMGLEAAPAEQKLWRRLAGAALGGIHGALRRRGARAGRVRTVRVAARRTREVGGLGPGRGLEAGYVGREVRLAAYETGRFDGIPANLPSDVGSWQDRAFAFRTSLVVLAER